MRATIGVEPVSDMLMGLAQVQSPSRASNAPITRSAFLRYAFWLGITGFGGGFAICQQIRTYAVQRGWIEDEAFLQAFSVANALPGAVVCNVVAMIAYRLFGSVMAFLAVIVFLAPSVALMVIFAIFYNDLRNIGAMANLLDGMGLATIGVIVAVAVDMGRSAIKHRFQFVIASGATVAVVLHELHLIEVVAIAAALGIAAFSSMERRAMKAEAAEKVASGAAQAPAETPKTAASAPASSSHLGAVALFTLASVTLPISLQLLITFTKISIATFGGGLAMIAPIEHEIVSQNHWMSAATLNDALVLGQITPGPVAVAASFIGWRIDGALGCLGASVGTYLPPIALAVFAARWLNRPLAAESRAALRGISAAVVGVILASGVALGVDSLHDLVGALLISAAFIVLLIRPKTSPMIILAVGGIIRMLVHHGPALLTSAFQRELPAVSPHDSPPLARSSA